MTASAVAVVCGLLVNAPAGAGEMPIADLHFHPDAHNSPAAMLKVMDAGGVQWAGLGVKGYDSDTRDLETEYSGVFGSRLIPFGGQSELNGIFKEGGLDAAESADLPEFKTLLARLEEDLKSGRIKGIGEIFVNNRTSGSQQWMRRKMKTDAPSLRAIFALAAKYNAFVGIHMQWDSDSVEQLETVMKASPGVRLLINHCGTENKASQMRPFLKKFSNAYCEVSFRYPPMMKAKAKKKIIFTGSSFDSGWKSLIEDYPDRFMVGTDSHSSNQYTGAIKTVRKGLLKKLRPETAKMVAYGNAQRLFDLK